jgi:hypothetical protein
MEMLGMAHGAHEWGGSLVAAVVASEQVLPLMVGEGDVAVGTPNGLAALSAEDEGGPTSPIQKQDSLLASV